MLKNSEAIANDVVRDVRVLFEVCKREIESMGIEVDMDVRPSHGNERGYFVSISIRNRLGRGFPVFFHIFYPTKDNVYETLSRLLEVLRAISYFKKEELGDEGELNFLNDVVDDGSVRISVDFLCKDHIYEFRYVEGVGVTFKYNFKDHSQPLEMILGTTEDMDKLRSNIKTILRSNIEMVTR